MTTINITTSDGLFCIYKGNKLYSVLETSSGSTITLSTNFSYIEHDTPADLSAWMASNNVSSKSSSVLFFIRQEQANHDNTGSNANPVHEPLRVAVSMPTGTEGIANPEDLEDTGGEE